MAVTWGAWEYAGGNGMRLGLDAYSGSAVDTNSATYTYKVDIWTENQYNHDGDTQAIPYSWPGVSSTLNYTNNEGSGTSTKRTTLTVTYTYTTWGSSPGTRTVLIGPLSLAYHGATPSHSRATTIPARPYAVCNPPTSVGSTRNSDTQTTISFANPATAQRPVTNFTIQVATYSGAAWGGWVDAYIGGATSVAIGTSPNHSYQWQVRANGPVGSSGFVAAPQTFTTPSAPSSVAANISGPNIVVTWVSPSYIASGITHTVQRSKDGGAWTTVASGIAQGTSTWTDLSVTGTTNIYRVSTYAPWHGGLTSSWTQAGVVVLGDCHVWDGSSLIPANLFLWNGTSEIPLSIDPIVVFRR